MNTLKIRMVALALAAGLSGGVQAASYSNPSSETPFNLSLDTGASAWQAVSAALASTSSTWTYSDTTTSLPFAVFVAPAPGVPGYFELQKTTTTSTYSESDQSSFTAFSARLAAPIDVSQSYLLSGQISKKSGETLLNNGNGNVDFYMGMNIGFTDLYTSGSANGLLTFRLGSTPGNWTYQFQTTFNTSNGGVTLRNRQYLDMNAPIFFEAEYGIGGIPGVQFGVNDLSLSVYGNVYGPTTLTDTITSTAVVPSTHIDYPALPAAVPEPAAWGLMLSGLTLVGAAARRRREKNRADSVCLDH